MAHSDYTASSGLVCLSHYFFMDKIEIVKFPTYGYGIRVTFENEKEYPYLYSFLHNELFQDCCNDMFKAIEPEFKCKDYNYVKNVIQEFGMNTNIQDLEVYIEPELPF